MTNFFRSSNWIVTVPLAAVGVAYLCLSFLPAKAHIAQLKTELKNQQMLVMQAQPVKLAVHRTQRDIAATTEYINNWKAKHRQHPGDVMAHISDQIQAKGIVTENFDPQPTKRHDVVQQTALELGVGGRFEDIFKMIRSLETLDATIWIHAIRFHAPLGDDRGLSSEISLAIFTVNPNISD